MTTTLRRRRQTRQEVLPVLACLLTATSGAVDALSYLHLGGAFSSAMTGNLALLGISVGGLRPGLLVRVVIAIAAYGLGIGVAAYFTRRVPDRKEVWPVEVTYAMVATTVPLLGALGLLAVSGSPQGAGQLPALALLALAMGMQSGAYRFARVNGVLGTTYVSGNVVVFFQSLAHRKFALNSLLSLLAIAAGAAAETAVVRAAPHAAGVLPLLLIVAVAVIALSPRFAAAVPDEGAGER